MLKFVLAILFFFNFNSASYAALSEAPMHYKVVYGDKISNFVILKDKKDYAIHFSDNQGHNQERKITLKDYRFLKKTAEDYKGQNDIAFCSRDYIQYTGLNQKRLGCLKSTTPIASKLRDTTNLLSLYF